MKTMKYFLTITMISLFFISCNTNSKIYTDLYNTPFGIVSKLEDFSDTNFYLTTQNQETYFLVNLSKLDRKEMLKSIEVSPDQTKLYILIENSNISYKPYGTALYVYDLENTENPAYGYIRNIGKKLNPIFMQTNQNIIDVTLTNNSISYLNQVGDRVTITFNYQE